MPAITLRSTQITLRSCCDHRTDHTAVRLRSSAITLCSIPPYPRADRSPALGRWARRFGDPKKGREARRGKVARCRHACSNRENRETCADGSRIMGVLGECANALVTVTFGSKVGSNALIRLDSSEQNQSLKTSSPRFCTSGKGFRARSLLNFNTLGD